MFFALALGVIGTSDTRVVTLTAAVAPAAEPFALADVSLAEGSAYAVARDRNREYIVGLNSSQLACIFTSAANLTRCVGGRSCPSPGGKSARVCNPLPGEMGLGAYYGHYLGHWLSATAFLINGTGDAAVKTKAEDMIITLNKTMEAWVAKYGKEHDGYLFPYDPIVFHYLHYPRTSGCTRHLCGLYSVPYYTLHKTMAGLLDHATHAANDLAWRMLLRMAAWVHRHATAAVESEGLDNWQGVLNTEWGGMNEVLYNLYALTGDPTHLAAGRLFNHWSWSAPLAAGIDDLGGNHANTHIPEVIGNAVGYEQTGNATDRAIVEEFFRAVTTNHSWATGGSNDGEYWGAARRMGDQLNGNTEESCTQYNILKVARHLFLWGANASYADFYERAILNGILGNQDRDDDASMTSFIYMLPLGAAGMLKPWGQSNRTFPCCWGTLSEQLSKMADSIYFRGTGSFVAPTLFINQYVASSVAFAAAGVSVVQSTNFPFVENHTTTITIAPLGTTASSLIAGDLSSVAPAPSRFIIKLRVPSWATSGRNMVLVNGAPHSGSPIVAGEYLNLHRDWAVGDSVSVHFPLGFAAEALNDDRPSFNSTLAFMYGPLVLSGLTTTRWFVPEGSPAEPSTFIKRVGGGTTLAFEARGALLEPTPPQRMATEGVREKPYVQIASTLKMVPLMAIVRERYTVYFETVLHTIPYAPAGAVVPSDTPADLGFAGGASAAGGPKDAACSGGNVRSGNPGHTTRVQLDHPLLAPGYEIASVSLAFRYAAGYTPPAGKQVQDPIVTATLTNSSGGTLVSLFTSPPLGNYSFDHFTTCTPHQRWSTRTASPSLYARSRDDPTHGLCSQTRHRCACRPPTCTCATTSSSSSPSRLPTGSETCRSPSTTCVAGGTRRSHGTRSTTAMRTITTRMATWRMG